MKTLIAAGLAASALAAATTASAIPVYRVDYHHPIHDAVAVRAPLAHRRHITIAPIFVRPVVFREGAFRPGFYRTAYYAHGYRGAFYRAPHQGYRWSHGRVVHHTSLRGAHAGEHRPA
jgi:hypothetical protein